MAEDLAMAKDLFPAVDVGAKTITIRTGHRDYSVGDKVNIFDVSNPAVTVEVRLSSVTKCRADQVPFEDLEADGFISYADFVVKMRAYYPDFDLDTDVTVISWKSNFTRNSILAKANDLMADFLYYDRKEDEDLEVGEIEQAIRDGLVSIDEIVAVVREQLERSVNE